MKTDKSASPSTSKTWSIIIMTLRTSMVAIKTTTTEVVASWATRVTPKASLTRLASKLMNLAVSTKARLRCAMVLLTLVSGWTVCVMAWARSSGPMAVVMKANGVTIRQTVKAS